MPATKLSMVHGDGAPSGSLVTKERGRRRKEGDVKARLCSLDKRILRFVGRFREFHSTVSLFLFLSVALALFAIVPHRAANVEPSNLENDVLKIPDNVFSLLYGSSC